MALKQFSGPLEMWSLFCDYRKDAKSDPFLIKDWVGKDGDQVHREKEKPLTMEGFELFSMEQGYNNSADLSEYFECKNESYKEFFPICRAIKKSIRQDQILGGMAQIYSPSITQRLNGLVEKSEQTVKQEQPFFQDVPKNDGG